ncbi:dCTP deaminase domain-containing protein [Novosphingobium huizhouense]|uniref:dCTP deaminase domain-containing protein n=1 Tax=Novosphingobium huizhouense TaxID=2866625 RepID=UPI001CD8DA7C|nr:hypothetical protein [Novosphingobium huizhouense]
MVLTSQEVRGKGIVVGRVPEGERPTTYDATVGSIIRGGVEINGPTYTLEPRQIIWLVSQETFDIGDSVTGLATLKTQWTHQGVLALNVGIVDPGWNGPLATAVVNFSNSPFEIKRGMPFLRLLFHSHAAIPATELRSKTVSKSDYIRQTLGQSRSFAPTFLDMDDLSRTVADRVLGLPRWGLILAFIAVVIGLFAISIPVGVAIWTDGNGDKAKIATLEAKVQGLEDRLTQPKIDPAKCQQGNLNGRKRLICPPE